MGYLVVTSTEGELSNVTAGCKAAKESMEFWSMSDTAWEFEMHLAHKALPFRDVAHDNVTED